MSISSNASCGVRADGTSICWGADDTLEPGGVFETVYSSGGINCGHKGDSSVECWRSERWDVDPSEIFVGSYRALVEGTDNGPAMCGIRTDGALECWAEDRTGCSIYDVCDRLSPVQVPDGDFVDAWIGRGTVCGIEADGAALCWSLFFDHDDRVLLPTDFPEGSYVQAFEHNFDYCALDVDGTVVCVEAYDIGEVAFREEMDLDSIFSLNSTFGNMCGLRMDGTVSCFDIEDGRLVEMGGVPAGNFDQVVTNGDNAACGIRVDGTVDCWAINTDGRDVDDERMITDQVPSGAFRSLSMENDLACGIKTDGSVVCWGDVGSRHQCFAQ